ncbi:MAG: hypothetical protein AVDCRST_MAG68-997 [uncultured Gemmatimonadetes bacterium]|uniref:Uncharacterized protein n=1 Tax=uncultured Gemmatimonadota bacterium TaxID=203437 RepID=A0A6J4KJE6_9BACT|nr:MAG: hypothetical protein AVDCRST_MAG68-997 [uncultured Gemmatimonadota bacterium]
MGERVYLAAERVETRAARTRHGAGRAGPNLSRRNVIRGTSAGGTGSQVRRLDGFLFIH